MTIRDNESIVNVEAVPVTDDYGMGSSDINVPFASAVAAVELEQEEPGVTAAAAVTPIVAPYSFGMSATSPVSRTGGQTQRGAPMIQQQQQHVVVQQPPPTQQQPHNGYHQYARRNNNQGCCNLTCCCVTALILGLCVILPIVGGVF